MEINECAPEQSQYLGLNAGALTYEEHWEVRSRVDLEGLEGTAIHNERDIANYAQRLVAGIINKITNITYAYFVRGNWLDLKVSSSIRTQVAQAHGEAS